MFPGQPWLSGSDARRLSDESSGFCLARYRVPGESEVRQSLKIVALSLFALLLTAAPAMAQDAAAAEVAAAAPLFGASIGAGRPGAVRAAGTDD